MGRSKSPSAAYLDDLKTFSVFQTIFNNYLGRKCHYVSHGDWTWTVLFFAKQNPEPWHFEQYYGKTAQRGEYVRVNAQRALREKRPLATRFGHFVDFFAPVPSSGGDGLLFSGSVLGKHPTPSDFRLYWKEVTGTEGSDLNPDFLYFVRTVLGQPILDADGIEGYTQLMGLLARWVSGDRGKDIRPQAEGLLKEVFAPQIPHPTWVDWMVGSDKFYVKPDRYPSMPQWVREEIGITRNPTVVAALMPQKPFRNAGALDILCLARRFQHECFLACRKIGEAASGPLGDYGAVVLSSAKPGLSPVQARLEVRERLQELCRNLGRTLQVGVRVGIGSLSVEGGSLPQSYREALFSLNHSVETGKDLVFFEDSPGRVSPPGTGILSLIRSFSDALSCSSPARLTLAREALVRKLLYGGYGPEVSRAYLVSILHLLVERFERRSGVDPASTRALVDKLQGRLESAVLLPDLIAAFREALDALTHYQESPREASTAARVEGVVMEIDRDPERPWQLLKLSRQTGMSPPTFLKWFQKVAGLPLGPYIRKARLAKAHALLKEGNLTLERIAQECGFSSASSFIQIFRRAQGIPPRRYHRVVGKN